MLNQKCRLNSGNIDNNSEQYLSRERNVGGALYPSKQANNIARFSHCTHYNKTFAHKEPVRNLKLVKSKSNTARKLVTRSVTDATQNKKNLLL